MMEEIDMRDVQLSCVLYVQVRDEKYWVRPNPKMIMPNPTNFQIIILKIKSIIYKLFNKKIQGIGATRCTFI